MQPELKIRLLKYLYDALNAAKEIELSTSGLSISSYQFLNTKWLVERGIEIISEALKRASVLENNLPLTDMNKIFATRNKIAHEYDVVDPFMLYNIVQKNIPILIKELKNYIDFLERS